MGIGEPNQSPMCMFETCLLAQTINPNAFTAVSDKGGNYEFIQNAEI